MKFMELVARHRNGHDLKAKSPHFSETLHISKSGRVFMMEPKLGRDLEVSIYLMHIRNTKWEIVK